MTHAYTPGLKVTHRERHSCRRILPIRGDVLVQTGDRVDAQDIVAQTFMPGDVTPVNMANLLSMPPGDVGDCMLKSEGERIEVGEVLARHSGDFRAVQERMQVAGKWNDRVDFQCDGTGHHSRRGTPR